jgi:hydrogenase maturation protease
MMKVLILGVGNSIMTDDGVGVHAARVARSLLAPSERIDVEEAEVAGFALLDLLRDRDRVIIIDALDAGTRAPGEVIVKSLEAFRPTLHLCTGHEIDLPTAVELGRRMGYRMPPDIRLVLVAVQDARTLGETCTPAVEGAIEPAARRAIELAREP